MVGGHIDQEEFSLGIEPFSPVAKSGLIRSNNAPTITTSNSSQFMMQPANRAHKTDNQLEDVKEMYLVFLPTI